MSYRYNGNDILAPASTDGSANTLFNYKISGVDAKYLKPFCTSTTTTVHGVLSDIPRFYANALNYKYNLVLDLSFCPRYNLHTSSQSGVTVPSGVTNMFVVCIGGGGGGGGGGVITGGGDNGGAGGGGGGGALKGWFVQSVSSTYNVTIGGGGTFGRPWGNTSVEEGRYARAGSGEGSGNAGGNGSATSFVYNGTTYSSPGGSGGSGGSTDTVSGGTGGTGGGTPTPFIWKDGNNGDNGIQTTTNNIQGGKGGGNGNYISSNYSLHINKKLVNIEKQKYNSVDETDINYSLFQCEYGDGGRGGRGEAPDNWAWAGYSGNPGCAIVFFYYNNISTGAPLVTTVTTTSTHTLNASTTAFKIIVVGGGGGGQAGVQYDGANKGACGGGGASGTSSSTALCASWDPIQCLPWVDAMPADPCDRFLLPASCRIFSTTSRIQDRWRMVAQLARVASRVRSVTWKRRCV